MFGIFDRKFFCCEIKRIICRCFRCIGRRTWGIFTVHIVEGIVYFFFNTLEVCWHDFYCLIIQRNNFPSGICFDHRIGDICFGEYIFFHFFCLFTQNRSKFCLCLFFCKLVSGISVGNDLTEKFSDSCFINISSVNVSDMCCDRSCTILNIKSVFRDFISHFFVDLWEEICVCGISDICIVQCGEITALNQGFHRVEVHFLHAVKKMFHCFSWLLSLIEIEAGTSSNGENQDQNENDQPGMSFFITFCHIASCLRVCLKNALRKMCVTSCRKPFSDTL